MKVEIRIQHAQIHQIPEQQDTEKLKDKIREGQDKVNQTSGRKDKGAVISRRKTKIPLDQAEQVTAASRIRNFQQDLSEKGDMYIKDTVNKEGNHASQTENKDKHMKDTQKYKIN